MNSPRKKATKNTISIKDTPPSQGAFFILEAFLPEESEDGRPKSEDFPNVENATCFRDIFGLPSSVFRLPFSDFQLSLKSVILNF
jgi:hypothetical protein